MMGVFLIGPSALLNMNVTRTRAHPQQRRSAMDFAANLFVRVSHAALNSHLDRLTDVDRPGTGGNVGVERRIRGQTQMNIARAGMNLPRAGLRPFGGHIAAPGLAAEAALHAASRN